MDVGQMVADHVVVGGVDTPKDLHVAPSPSFGKDSLSTGQLLRRYAATQRGRPLADYATAAYTPSRRDRRAPFNPRTYCRTPSGRG